MWRMAMADDFVVIHRQPEILESFSYFSLSDLIEEKI
jgi:hypothetical protein